MSLRRGELYPLRDRPVELGRRVERRGLTYENVSARWDGNPPRCPKKGQWYLSGAVIEAYRAPNDLTTPFHMAELVETERVTVVKRVLR